MKGKSLIDVVGEIIGRKPTEVEARNFASEQWGVLMAYQRAEWTKSVKTRIARKPAMVVCEKGYRK